jgi:putative tricarboxylic transport membrane protein
VNAPDAAGEGGGPGWRGLLAIGAALALVALAVWLDAQRLPPPPTVGVGPSAAMRLVAAVVALLAMAHLIAAWRARRRAPSGDADAAPAHGDLASLAWVLGALVGLIAILQLGGGFVAASTWLFAATARGFGATLSVKSIALGFALAALVYVFFTRALTLGLPAGPLERLIG